jgi:replicative DNA helicase
MDEIPHDPQAERAILGSILMDNGKMVEARAQLKADSFYNPLHRRVWIAATSLHDEGREADPITLCEKMREQQALREGEQQEIFSLITGIPYKFSITPYIEIVRHKAQRRWLIRFGQELSQRGQDGDESEAELIRWADSRLELVRPRIEERQRKPAPLIERLSAQAARFEKFYKGISDCVATGFQEIDSKLTGAGFGRKHLVVLAARPSIGKTSLALDFAANAASRGQRALIFSLEMSAEMLIDRLVSVESGVSRWKIQAGIRQFDYERISEALPNVCEKSVIIDDSSFTLSDIKRHTREVMRSQSPADLILVDYLQLIDADRKNGSRNDDVGEVSRALKLMAMEWNVPVLALSQLSRNCESQNREPELRDLRDSGEIEQNADTVFFLFGDKPEEKVSFRDITIKCAKQREGMLFRTQMPFNCELVTFRALSHVVRTIEDVPFEVAH